MFAHWKVTPVFVLSDYLSGCPITNCQWGRTSCSRLFVFYNESLNFALPCVARCSSFKWPSRLSITASSADANVRFLCMRNQHPCRWGLRILNLIAFIWLITWLSKLYKQSTGYRGADKSLARSDWKNNWKVAIFRPTRKSLLPRRSGWTENLLIFFLSGLQKLDFGRSSLFPSWSG